MSKIVECSECGGIVELTRNDNNQLIMRCDCLNHNIVVEQPPTEWQ